MGSGYYKRLDTTERFSKKVQKGDYCWNWIAARNKLGYGVISYKGRPVLAHRLSFLLFKGEIPQGYCVCHTCDNPICVKPEHLWLGTHKENMRDKALKGRARSPKGEEKPNAKLTRELVKDMRNLYSTGEFSHNSLAETFNVSKATVYYVVNGKLWK